MTTETTKTFRLCEHADVEPMAVTISGDGGPVADDSSPFELTVARGDVGEEASITTVTLSREEMRQIATYVLGMVRDVDNS